MYIFHFFFQLRIEARRQFEVTVQVAYCGVTVTVIRNETEPKFGRRDYKVDPPVSEKIVPGTQILTVTATDKDQVNLVNNLELLLISIKILLLAIMHYSNLHIDKLLFYYECGK